MADEFKAGTAFVAGGTVTGAWVSTAVGGMGLAGGFGAVGIGMTPVAAAGGIAGAATYGVFRAIQEKDAVAFGALGLGAFGGAGVSAAFGGMGLAAGGTAVGIGTGTMAAVGGVFGLGVYGFAKMLDKPGTREPLAQTFARMSEKILLQSAYNQALLELDPNLAEYDWKQKFAALEIEDELKALKTQINSTASSPRSAEPNIEPEEVSLKPQIPQTWKCVHTLKGHTASVNSVAISLDGETIASGSDDKTVNLWKLKTGKLLYTFWGQAKEVYSVAISPDGKTLTSGSFDGKITSWKLDTKVLLCTFLYLNFPYSHSGLVYSVAYSPDGKILASGSAERTIRLWNRYTGKIIRTLNGHSDSILSIAISPDGNTLVSGSADRTIALWCLRDGRQLSILTGHSGWVTCCAISPDGKTLASGSTDSTIKLWNLQTAELIRTLAGHDSAVFSVAISPDGNTLASGSTNCVKIWNLNTGELLETLSGCHPVTFSPDGNTLVSGGEGGTIEIWHLCCGVTESQLESVPSGEWWEILGVNKNASPDEVKQAYRKLVRQYHPDVNNSANAKAIMQAINKAYKQFRQLK